MLFDDYDFYLCGLLVFMCDLYDGLCVLNVLDECICFEVFGLLSVLCSVICVVVVFVVVSVLVVFWCMGCEVVWMFVDGMLFEFVEG